MSAPLTVRLAALGIGIHAVNHVLVLVFSPFSWHVGTVFHLISAPLYAALLLPVLRGRNWARITITVLLGGQFLGRFVVWVLFPTTGAHLALLAGWTLSLIVFALLWTPPSTRLHFRHRAPELSEEQLA
ncbi:hypothetical protein [Nocardia brasiliensis]|uniref:Uncharacterized protein n=1 Tax=Nocardia brasiliensis (strain ATCC 700358 / HUJEG-1) TaxID=1133849 RepID=K0F8J0_NOCB7|nr:hypothetical protein [Nocardia brasiliensis]AFU06032.1 hypothetical protein O3I_040435 [Nocardia brasiliensis ATCC 700358]OCF90180.1 hypothetical protein AW168_13770 [Nocardia brasiliensis]